MSGHNKWAKVKHVKAKVDAIRGRAFTKVIKEITIAAKLGGGDPDSNPRLRTALVAAKDCNMPKDNIDRAIKKGTGELGNAVYEEKIYEGYGPNGVAILVEVLTDNNNRAAANIRNIFNKTSGNLGATGSVSYMFKRAGVISYDSEKVNEDEIMEAGLEAGADDITNDDGVITVTTDPAEFANVLEALQGKGYEALSAEVAMVPDTYCALDNDAATKLQKLIDRLEEDDDVQNVYTNAEYPEGFEAE